MERKERPARQAVKEASGTLLHWSSAPSAVAVVVAAHWLAASGNAGDHAGLVYGSSFVVFALLLPAVSLLREYVDRRTTRLQEVLRSSSVSAETLKSQRQMFDRLAGTAAPLQRAIVLTVIAAVASSVAIIAPSVTVWDDAPSFLVFSLADLLTGLALICLIGTVAATFPFTWHLLIRSDQLRAVEEAINLKGQVAQSTGSAQTASAGPAELAEPSAPVGGNQQSPRRSEETGTDAEERG
jgi:hypothetical protein